MLPKPLPIIGEGFEPEVEVKWKVKGLDLPVRYKNLPYSGPVLVSFPMPEDLCSLSRFVSHYPGPVRTDPVSFNSYFQSGNIDRVYKKGKHEFDLFMRPDTNSSGRTQWFYFEAQAHKPGTYTFNILNFTKPQSLLGKGMKPLVFEEGEWKQLRKSTYIKNGFEGRYYTLSWSFCFKVPEQKVYFALTRPYTYSDLQSWIQKIETKAFYDKGAMKVKKPNLSYKREKLCESLSGLRVDLLSITGDRVQNLRKKVAFITARVHPSETASSFILENLVNFLLSNHKTANTLRKLYIFKVIPMLNPDGVFVGNSRTSVQGSDLNRQWQNPSPQLHPTIFATKNLIKKLSSKREIAIYCDLHGHEKNYNSFIYGCNTAANGGFATWTKVRLFPRILARISEMFCYDNCRFKVTEDKLGTGRVVVWKELGVTNSFTLETSFFGYQKDNTVVPFGLEEFNSLGESFCKALLEYSYLLKELEKEFVYTKGWLKPGKLKELSGIPAQQLAAQKNLRRSRLIERKKSLSQMKTPKSKPLLPKFSIYSEHSESEFKSVCEENEVDTKVMNYFTVQEIQNVIQKIDKGEEFSEPDTSGSDSACSEDSLSRESSIILGHENFKKQKRPTSLPPFKVESEPRCPRFLRIDSINSPDKNSAGYFTELNMSPQNSYSGAVDFRKKKSVGTTTNNFNLTNGSSKRRVPAKSVGEPLNKPIPCIFDRPNRIVIKNPSKVRGKFYEKSKQPELLPTFFLKSVKLPKSLYRYS